MGPSGGSQTLLVALEEVVDSPCVSSQTGFYLPFYLYFTLWYLIHTSRAFLRQNIEACVREADLPVSVYQAVQKSALFYY